MNSNTCIKLSFLTLIACVNLDQVCSASEFQSEAGMFKVEMISKVFESLSEPKIQSDNISIKVVEAGDTGLFDVTLRDRIGQEMIHRKYKFDNKSKLIKIDAAVELP